MKANQVKDVPRIAPNKEGVKVFLAKHIEHKEGDKGDSYLVTFTGKDKIEGVNPESTFTFLDPYTPQDTAKPGTIQADYNTLFRLAKALMPPANYAKFEDIEIDSLKEAIRIINSMIDPNWANLELLVMPGFNDYTGYLGFSRFEPWVSSPHAPRSLEWDSQMHLTRAEFTPSKPVTKKDGAVAPTPDKEEEF